MALEDEIKKLTAAVEANTLEMKNLVTLRTAAVETAKEITAPKAASSKKTEKPAADTAPVTPPAVTTQTEPATPPAVSEEEEAARRKQAALSHPVGGLVLQYVSSIDEAHPQATDERAARTQAVLGIYDKVRQFLVGQGQVDAVVKSYADIPEQLYQTVIEGLNKMIAAGNLVIKAAPGPAAGFTL